MDIKKEITGENTATLLVNLQPDDFMPIVNTELEKIRKKASFPGFRPGKAPLGMVKKQYLKSVILEEVNKMSYEHLDKYIEENKIRLIGRPLINLDKTPKIEDLTETQTYVFAFDIGILPEFDVELTKDVEVEFKNVSVNDDVLNSEIENLKQRHASYDKAETVTEDCMVTGHLTVKLNSDNDSDESKESEEVDKNKNYKYFYINKLDKNPKLKSQFIGKKSSEELFIDINDIDDKESIEFLLTKDFDYTQKEVSVSFILAEIYVSQPAELNEALFEKVFQGRDIKTEDDFKNNLKKELEKHFVKQCDDIFLFDVRKKLVAETKLDLPADFVKRFLNETSNQDEDPKKIEEINEKFEDYLELIKWEFIQSKLFEKHNVTIQAEDFKNYIRDYYKDSMNIDDVSDEQIQKDLKNILENKKSMDSIEDAIRRQKSINLLKDNLTLKTKDYKSFEDMVEKNKDDVKSKPKTKKKVETEKENA